MASSIQAVRVTLRLDDLAGERLQADERPIAGVDPGGVHLGHVDHDPHDVVAHDHKERRAAGAGLGQVARVHVAPGDHARVRGRDRLVAAHRRGSVGVEPGDLDRRGGGDHVGVGLVDHRLALFDRCLGGLDLGLDLIAARLGRAELAPGLVEQAAGERSLAVKSCSTRWNSACQRSRSARVRLTPAWS